MTQLSNDTDPLSKGSNGIQTDNLTRRFSRFQCVLVTRIAPLSFIIAVFSFMPVSANTGGLFSAIAELWGEQHDVVVTARTYNTQNALILEGVTSIEPNKSLGGGDIVVSGGALVPEVGPLGSAANFIDVPKSGHISVYVVREGDTLSQIGNMFGVSVNTILWANDIKEAIIHKGDALVILPVSGVKYTVKKDDTLKSIAKEYKADEEEISLFNGLTIGAMLVVGDEIIIPGGEAGPVRVAARVAGLDSSKFLMRPIKGGVRTQGIHGYNGVDLASYEGAPVYAAAAGRVIISRDGGSWNGGYGNYVVIEHGNGAQTLYAHLLNNEVRSGQYVSQGQVVGYMGSTGRSTGPHLHFEVRGAVNPY
ncbi:MAG: peptidoglycan DD-metalloendopeptidase family protein [bacterium]|nr:peptidoglycan DD-metalloendopeptidase family protein [bacterium]